MEITLAPAGNAVFPSLSLYLSISHSASLFLVLALSDRYNPPAGNAGVGGELGTRGDAMAEFKIHIGRAPYKLLDTLVLS